MEKKLERGVKEKKLEIEVILVCYLEKKEKKT